MANGPPRYTSKPVKVIKPISRAVPAQPVKKLVALNRKREETLSEMLFGNSSRAMTESSVRSKAPSLIVDALAGTGKTTAIKEGVWRLRGQKKFKGSEEQEAIWDAICQGSKPDTIAAVAFNKSIGDVLKTELKGLVTVAGTVHSLAAGVCFKHFRGVTIDKYRTGKLLEEYQGEDIRSLLQSDRLYVKAVEELVGLTKLTLTEPTMDNLLKLASQYGIVFPSDRAEKTCETCLWILDRAADKIESMDFNDMIWLPLVKKIKLPVYDLLMGDEVQDWNRCQQEFLLQSSLRMVLAGDRNQAIYGYAGADTQSIPRMAALLEERGEVQRLPLTVTRRCGEAIVAESNKIVPDLKAHPSTGKGLVEFNVPQEEADRLLEDRDMILCRVNAPLIGLAFKYIRLGYKAQIQGRNIGRDLWNFCERRLEAVSVKDLLEKVDEYQKDELKNLRSRKWVDEAMIINLQDRCNCVRALSDGCKTMREIKVRIEAVFQDQDQGGIILSSVHRAKGMEAKRVWIREPNKMPHPKATKDWEMEQEYNLKYVAITRAAKELRFVQDTKRSVDELDL